MHDRIKENRPKLNNEMKTKIPEPRKILGAIPMNRKSMNGSSKSRIVLPKIRESIIHKLDVSCNINNLTSVKEHQLPSLPNSGKATNDGISKERYIKYKSLLKRQNQGNDRNAQWPTHHNQPDVSQSNRLESSLSSQNMSVQEMMLDKVYGTIERDAKSYL